MISILIPSNNEKQACQMMAEVEREFPQAQIILANDRYRKGKGWAMRQALTQTTGDIVCFIDADMDIHPKMIKRLLPHLNEFDIVVGKKDTRTLFSRYIVTLLSRLFIYMLFKIKVDTQTGVKVFKRYALLDWETNGFAFDIEILNKAQQLGFKLFEVTIEANIRKRVKLKSIWNTFWETVKIYRRRYIGNMNIRHLVVREYNKQENKRRRKQIALGQLKKENGLLV